MLYIGGHPKNGSNSFYLQNGGIILHFTPPKSHSLKVCMENPHHLIFHM